MSIKKMMLVVGLLFTISAFSATQFDIIQTKNVNDLWNPVFMSGYVEIQVNESSSIWISTFVSNNYTLEIEDLSTKADMNVGNYGYTINGVSYASSGITSEISFSNQVGTVTTTSYYIGDFEAGDVIGIWVTKDGVIGDAYSSVSAEYGELGSRQINTVDVYGNTRINYGFTSTGSVEFIISSGELANGASNGQPLPSVIASFVLGAGALIIRRKMKNNCIGC